MNLEKLKESYENSVLREYHRLEREKELRRDEALAFMADPKFDQFVMEFQEVVEEALTRDTFRVDHVFNMYSTQISSDAVEMFLKDRLGCQFFSVGKHFTGKTFPPKIKIIIDNREDIQK